MSTPRVSLLFSDPLSVNFDAFDAFDAFEPGLVPLPESPASMKGGHEDLSSTRVVESSATNPSSPLGQLPPSSSRGSVIVQSREVPARNMSTRRKPSVHHAGSVNRRASAVRKKESARRAVGKPQTPPTCRPPASVVGGLHARKTTAETKPSIPPSSEVKPRPTKMGFLLRLTSRFKPRRKSKRPSTPSPPISSTPKPKPPALDLSPLTSTPPPPPPLTLSTSTSVPLSPLPSSPRSLAPRRPLPTTPSSDHLQVPLSPFPVSVSEPIIPGPKSRSLSIGKKSLEGDNGKSPDQIERERFRAWSFSAASKSPTLVAFDRDSSDADDCEDDTRVEIQPDAVGSNDASPEAKVALIVGEDGILMQRASIPLPPSPKSAFSILLDPVALASAEGNDISPGSPCPRTPPPALFTTLISNLPQPKMPASRRLETSSAPTSTLSFEYLQGGRPSHPIPPFTPNTRMPPSTTTLTPPPLLHSLPTSKSEVFTSSSTRLPAERASRRRVFYMFEGPVDSDDSGSESDEEGRGRVMKAKGTGAVGLANVDTAQMMRNMGLKPADADAGSRAVSVDRARATSASPVAVLRAPIASPPAFASQQKGKVEVGTQPQPRPQPTRKSTIAGLWKRKSKVDLKVDTGVSVEQDTVPPLPSGLAKRESHSMSPTTTRTSRFSLTYKGKSKTTQQRSSPPPLGSSSSSPAGLTHRISTAFLSTNAHTSSSSSSRPPPSPGARSPARPIVMHNSEAVDDYMKGVEDDESRRLCESAFMT